MKREKTKQRSTFGVLGGDENMGSKRVYSRQSCRHSLEALYLSDLSCVAPTQLSLGLSWSLFYPWSLFGLLDSLWSILPKNLFHILLPPLLSLELPGSCLILSCVSSLTTVCNKRLAIVPSLYVPWVP